MDRNQMKRMKALEKELFAIEKQEKKMEQAALKARPAAWKVQLESKIPARVYCSLQSAFCKGFHIVFDQGRRIIEKSYRKEEIQADYSIRDYAVQVKGGRRELKQIKKSARQSDRLNMAVTAAEGIGLGVLGIGMPDIVLFLGMLLRGIYETALNYGYDYESREEQFLILKMMTVSCSGNPHSRNHWRGCEPCLLSQNYEVCAAEISEEIFIGGEKEIGGEAEGWK